MDKAELLSTFKNSVEQFERYRGFIDKAKKSGGKFAAAVVEKVIQDNEEKSVELIAEVTPLLSKMQSVMSQLAADKQAILDGRQDSEFRLQELELRREIGDLTEAEFEQEAAEFKAVVDSTDAKVADIEGEVDEFEQLLKRWNKVAAKAGVPETPPPAKATPAPAPRREPDPPPRREPDPPPRREPDPPPRREPDPPPRREPDPPPRREPDPPPRREPDPPATSRRKPAPVPEPEPEPFDDEPEAEPEPLASADESELDFGDDVGGGSGGAPFEEEGGGFELGDLDIDIGDDDLDLGGNNEGGNESRRAVLLYQEGTAEEQIYPFNGEVMSLGRGRDNDVQVKNDSKVSRYHCKLYRRGPNFYIEDNKSANGTLVNGELITERRLFGGEEVIIGETFFRFRILD